MKKAIFTLALILSIGATQVSLASSAPKHRYHPTTQQVDKQAAAGQASAAQDDEAIAAYSDTTATDTTDYADVDDNANRAYHSKYSLGNYDDPFDFIGSVFGGGALSVIVIFCIIFGNLGKIFAGHSYFVKRIVAFINKIEVVASDVKR